MANLDTAPVIRAERLTKSFRSGGGRLEVLRDASFSLQAGQSLSIRGESGCGKTTLLNLLSGLERPDDGAVWWDEREVSDRSNRSMARMRSRFLGMVFQGQFLVPELNALENVLLAARIARSPVHEARLRAEALLEKVGLSDRLRSLPATLSGGERQRVALARALLNRPRVVMADEPTGNLDERTSEEVIRLLLRACAEEGASLILVTHNPAHARRTELAGEIQQGRLSVSGQDLPSIPSAR